VFIGQDIDKENIIETLEKCLLTTEEVALFNRKLFFEDPFPKNI
jgi:hypothetical protein